MSADFVEQVVASFFIALVVYIPSKIAFRGSFTAGWAMALLCVAVTTAVLA